MEKFKIWMPNVAKKYYMWVNPRDIEALETGYTEGTYAVFLKSGGECTVWMNDTERDALLSAMENSR